MDDALLCKIGLSKAQALAYRALVTRKGLRPVQVAKLIGETRSNTYALLDKLVDLGIAYREDIDKKLTYFPESPQKLESLISARIAEEQATLERLKRKMPEMLTVYNADRHKPKITIETGKKAVIEAHREHAQQAKELIFIHSRRDIGFMSAPLLRELRWNYDHNKVKRLAFSEFSTLVNPEIDKVARLSRVWMPEHSYNSPVEWSVNGDQVLISVYSDEGYAIKIDNPTIAQSLRQFLKIGEQIAKSTSAQKNYTKRLKKKVKAYDAKQMAQTEKELFKPTRLI